MKTAVGRLASGPLQPKLLFTLLDFNELLLATVDMYDITIYSFVLSGSVV